MEKRKKNRERKYVKIKIKRGIRGKYERFREALR